MSNHSINIDFGALPGQVVVTADDTRLVCRSGPAGFVADGKEADLSALTIASVSGSLDGEGTTLTFAPIPFGDGALELQSHFQWFDDEGLLRKQISYRFTGSAPKCVEEIELDRLDLHSGFSLLAPIPQNLQSHPAFFWRWFVGVEFPIATVRQEGETLKIAHAPWLTPKADEWYKSRTMVCGLSKGAPESSKEAFLRYLKGIIGERKSELHYNYNSWYTAPCPYFTEQDILTLTDQLEKGITACGGAFDSFTIDMGWSKPESIWEIDYDSFPDGFSNLEKGAAKTGGKLGLWFSPSACYPTSLNLPWAKEQGYFASPSPADGGLPHVCLTDDRYVKDMTAHLTEILQKYHIKQVKADALVLDCADEGHGHRPGPYGAEKIAENLLFLFHSLKKAVPDLWIESTCLKYNPSPWWLPAVDSVLGSHGDDVPQGRCPAPSYREACTSSRDFYNFQGALSFSVPLEFHDEMGVVHQTPDDFTNDMVTNLMRGNRFVPFYINPAYMTPERWQRMADIMAWGKTNQQVLSSATPIPFASWKGREFSALSHEAMPREPYGYAHGNLILLRNPWMEATSLEITVPASYVCDLVSLYPEVRCYQKGVLGGSRVTIPLLPYETLVLSVQQSAQPLPQYRPQQQLQVNGKQTPDGYSAQVEVPEGTELYVLAEASEAFDTPPQVMVTLDGAPAALEWSGTNQCWDAALLPRFEHWMFGKVSMPKGTHQIDFAIKDESDFTLSAYLWSRKPGKPGLPAYPNALPEPEWISVESSVLF